MMMMKKTILYTRVSTEEQVRGYSLGQQRTALVNYCKNQKIRKYEVYEDDGHSAKTIKRPKYLELLDDIENDRVERIIFFKLDRIARSVIDFKNLMVYCEEKNRITFYF